MRVMVMVRTDKNTEAGCMPSTETLAAMGEFNEKLVKAGVMLAGDGLHPSSKGVRMDCTGGRRLVIDGPFTETKELIAGYWLWKVESMDEAIEWVKQAPFQEGLLELRQVMEAEDFGAELTPELREQEDRLRDEMKATG